MYKLIIADDHSIVRDGIRPLFERRADVEIVAETNDGLETISAIKRFQPDVVLLDVSMPFVSGVEICIEAKRWSPNSRLIIFTGMNSGAVLHDLVEEGAKGIILKSEDVQLLSTAFDQVIAGNSFYSQAVSTLLESAQRANNLTSREKQVVKLIVSGNTTAEIAELLSVSAKTIENHRTNLMKKLEVHSISELMAFAYRENIAIAANDSQ